MSRKAFLGTLAAGTIYSGVSRTELSAILPAPDELLSSDQLDLVASVQEILFPSDGNGPGAGEINATNYLLWVLDDPYMDPDDVRYIINGIGWVDETSIELYNRSYSELTQAEKESMVASISKEDWGESWLSIILSYIFEALICDPAYGGNPNQTGWNWLTYKSGIPRPSGKLLYPDIILTIRDKEQKNIQR